MLINLIYGSSSLQPMTELELIDLLEKSRAKNRSLGITGMLLYRSGNFLQVLEGDDEAVEALFEDIRLDSRHDNVELIATRPVPERSFGAWEMGFVDLDTVDPRIVEGYTTFLDEPLNSERFHDLSFAFTFLNVFREGIR